MANATFTINGVAVTGAIAVSASSTVTLALTDTTGVLANATSWSIVGTHSSSATAPTITPGGTPNGVTATFPMPAGDGQAYLVQAVINGGKTASGTVDSTATFRAIVGVTNVNGFVPFVNGETTERSVTHGIVEPLNELSGASFWKGPASVVDYGATGDGVTDDTDAFTDALAANDVIYVPSGTYIVENITLGAGKGLYGDGDSSVLRYPPGDAGGAAAKVLTLGGNGAWFHSVTIDGNQANVTNASSSDWGVVSANASGVNSRMANCKITGSERYGVYITAAETVQVDNVRIDTSQHYALYNESSDEVAINGLTIDSCARGLISDSSCNKTSMVGVTIRGCTGYDLQSGGIDELIVGLSVDGASGSSSLVSLGGTRGNFSGIRINGARATVGSDYGVVNGISLYSTGSSTNYSLIISGDHAKVTGAELRSSYRGVELNGNYASISDVSVSSITAGNAIAFTSGSYQSITGASIQSVPSNGIASGATATNSTVIGAVIVSAAGDGLSIAGDNGEFDGITVVSAGDKSTDIASGAASNRLRNIRSVTPVVGDYADAGTNTVTSNVDGAPNVSNATTSHTWQVGGTSELALTASAMYPTTDGGLDAGITGTNRFAAGYFSGAVSAGSFSGATAALSSYVQVGGGTYPSSGAIRLGSSSTTMYGNDGVGDRRMLLLNSSNMIVGETNIPQIQNHATSFHYWYLGGSTTLILSASALRPQSDGGLSLGNSPVGWSSAYLGGGTYPTSGALRLGSSNPTIYAHDGSTQARIFNYSSGVLAFGEATTAQTRVRSSTQVDLVVGAVNVATATAGLFAVMGVAQDYTYTVATAPSAASYTGGHIYVSDGDAGSPGPAWSNGTNWINYRTGVAIATS